MSRHTDLPGSTDGRRFQADLTPGPDPDTGLPAGLCGRSRGPYLPAFLPGLQPTPLWTASQALNVQQD